MGRTILTMHVSTDGYISRPDGSLWPSFGWPPQVQGLLNNVYRGAGQVVYGRRIFDAVVPFWTSVARGEGPADVPVGEEGEEFARLLAPLPKIVVSKTMPEPDAGTRVLRENAVRALAELADAEPKDTIVLAGSRLTSDLISAGVLDEIVLILGAILVGQGLPLLEGLAAELPLELVEAQAFPPTTSWIRYRLP